MDRKLRDVAALPTTNVQPAPGRMLGVSNAPGLDTGADTDADPDADTDEAAG